MKKSKKALLVLATSGAFALTAFSPVTVTIEPDAVLAQAYKANRHLIYFQSGEPEKEFDYIKSVSKEKDDAYEKIREYMKNGKLKASAKKLDKLSQDWNGISDTAFYIEDIRKNEELQQFARKALQSGVKVYLYGESLTIQEYKKIMGIEKISAELYFSNESELLQAKKGIKPELKVESDQTYQVIGYTTVSSQPNQYFLGQIQGIVSPMTFKPHMFMQLIMDNQIDTLDAVEKMNEEQQSPTALVKQNTAFADSIRVKLGPNETTNRYRTDGLLAGSITSSYELFRDPDEIDPNFDNISIIDIIQTKTYNYTTNKYLSVFHKLPAASIDDLHDWGPNSTNISWNLSVAIPWGLQWQISNSSSISVEDQSDKSLDQGAWWVGGEFGGYFDDTALFKPGISVISKGTMASIDLSRTAFFRHSYWIDGRGFYTDYSVAQVRHVAYDY